MGKNIQSSEPEKTKNLSEKRSNEQKASVKLTLAWYEKLTIRAWTKEFRKNGVRDIEGAIEDRTQYLIREVKTQLEKAHPLHNQQLSLFLDEGYVK